MFDSGSLWNRDLNPHILDDVLEVFDRNEFEVYELRLWLIFFFMTYTLLELPHKWPTLKILGFHFQKEFRIKYFSNMDGFEYGYIEPLLSLYSQKMVRMWKYGFRCWEGRSLLPFVDTVVLHLHRLFFGRILNVEMLNCRLFGWKLWQKCPKYRKNYDYLLRN